MISSKDRIDLKSKSNAPLSTTYTCVRRKLKNLFLGTTVGTMMLNATSVDWAPPNPHLEPYQRDLHRGTVEPTGSCLD
jgi:hypothetical protein